MKSNVQGRIKLTGPSMGGFAGADMMLLFGLQSGKVQIGERAMNRKLFVLVRLQLLFWFLMPRGVESVTSHAALGIVEVLTTTAFSHMQG